MRQAEREGDHGAVDEDGADDLDVVEVVTAQGAHVVDQRVTLGEPLERVDLQQLADRVGHGAEMDGDVAALRDQVAARIGYGGGEIAGLAQQRRERADRINTRLISSAAAERPWRMTSTVNGSSGVM